MGYHYLRYLTATNHKLIAISYFSFGISARILRASMSLHGRIHLSSPGARTMIPDMYNFLVTAHRLVIIFFFLMPVLIRGFRNYLLPIYLQVPDIAIPPNCGWTIYPPLSSWIASPRTGVDYLIFSLHLARVSSIIRSINFLVTIIDSATIRMSNLFPS